jgi:NADP-dependent 3-hydroxy acid dehydrogenase YdfG
LGKRESINSIINSFETPDLLVANAGIAVNGAIGEIKQIEKDYYYYLMCGGVIDLIEGFIPKMTEKRSGKNCNNIKYWSNNCNAKIISVFIYKIRHSCIW